MKKLIILTLGIALLGALPSSAHTKLGTKNDLSYATIIPTHDAVLNITVGSEKLVAPYFIFGDMEYSDNTVISSKVRWQNINIYTYKNVIKNSSGQSEKRKINRSANRQKRC